MIIATNSRMFVTNASTRSNAMVVTKEGRVGIGANTHLWQKSTLFYILLKQMNFQNSLIKRNILELLLIAQKNEEIVPNIVFTDGNGYKAGSISYMDYIGFDIVAVKAVQ